MLRGNEESVSRIPLVILAREVLTRDELRIEHCILGPILPIGHIDGLKDSIHKLLVSFIWRNLQSKELGSISQSIHTDGEVLLAHIDKSSFIHIQHVGSKEILNDFIEGSLILVHLLCHLADIFIDI